MEAPVHGMLELTWLITNNNDHSLIWLKCFCHFILHCQVPSLCFFFFMVGVADELATI